MRRQNGCNVGMLVVAWSVAFVAVSSSGFAVSGVIGKPL